MTDFPSVVTNRDRDCTSCRAVSGIGLIGAGLYVAYHSKQFHKSTGKIIMISIAGTCIGLGIARVMDLPPFRHRFEKN